MNMKKSKVMSSRHSESLTFSTGYKTLHEYKYLDKLSGLIPTTKRKFGVELLWAGEHSASTLK